MPASLPGVRYTKLLIYILTNSLVLIGFSTEPDLQYILCLPLICLRVINPDYSAVLSTMAPNPQLDISNWISLQTQHIHIKLPILILEQDFLPKLLVINMFFKKSWLKTLLLIYLLNPISWLYLITLSHKSAIFYFCPLSNFYPFSLCGRQSLSEGFVFSSINFILSLPLYSSHFHFLTRNSQLTY